MARKWRPSSKCLYVISEIHGNAKSLEIILSRILPMRKHKGSEDQLIFLGDYIDKGQDTSKVIELIINVKNQYGERVRCLKGNHEHMLLKALTDSEKEFDDWINKGGISTITSYLDQVNIKASPYGIRQARLNDIIPKTHIEFLKQTETVVKIDNYTFFHGGFDPKRGIDATDETSILYDASSTRYVKECVNKGIEPVFTDTCVYVCAHNNNSKEPFVHSRYIALGGTAPAEIYIMELNSMQMDKIGLNMGRIYKHEYKLFI